MPQTLFDKIWDAHTIASGAGEAALVAIDFVFLHERTGAVALNSLQKAGREIRHPSRVFCTVDHIVSNAPERSESDARSPGGDVFIRETRAAAQRTGINFFDVMDPRQGIVHVIAPELGIVQPGATLVCPDSHTCSLGAFGAMAWGIGSSEAEHALATGTVRVAKPKQMRIRIEGQLGAGVSAKDLALHLIQVHGADGGQRMAIEFAGSTIRNMSVESRLTLCNLAVEFAAFTALIAPDAVTIDYLSGREFAPTGHVWHLARESWGKLRSDADAVFDAEIEIDAADVPPVVTWGTSPAQACSVRSGVPEIAALPAPAQASALKAMAYMGLSPGTAVMGLPVDGAFIGSCTNGRLEDLRAAASILRGRTVAPGVRAVCVPGSQSVRVDAEAEGLDKVFRDAGFSWGAPGCAMCFYAGGETFAPEARVMSSTNRNFEGRQGPGVRTHLASPAMVAAAAVSGCITDCRDVPGKAAT
ncbi:3-isopropylmalate dehydratase large subunit [Hyphomonas johnsonii]|uniref:3-isopropylmalate dehydratase n=1 Tax=Hyphomonas johnsonii MHS-2 TaxID=1280950 RepID=A0A059FFY2_9PROT|nr:3-isopropylmalate dehydratase large subunit [Hyphomonas johnsonii]KCZ89525.1 isopropylmalate isomerase large subunit [Hyphomonas johnsonii MHS-2]